MDVPVGHRVAVGEHSLWMHRSGDGEPATVFVPGGGSFGLDFLLAHEQVAQLTTSVLYDRAGTGWSDDADLPRTADEVTDELRALLLAVGVRRPTCSWATRSAASTFSASPSVSPTRSPAAATRPSSRGLGPLPARTSAIGVEPVGEIELPELSDELLAQVRANFETMLAGFPASIRRQLIDKRLSPDRVLTGIQEGGRLLDDLDDLRNGGAETRRALDRAQRHRCRPVANDVPARGTDPRADPR